jgi:glycosyltransferase involved in cell wall biosynthesis
VLTLARRATGVIVTNREDQLALEAYHIAPRPTVIPIGSNITPTPPPGYDRAAWREQCGVGPHETLLGYFGFLNESKGGEDLIEALDRLRERPVRLMMIGGRTGSSDPSNQAYADRIDALIRGRDLQERVIWTGYTTPAEVSANLLATDLCLLPYRDGVSFRRGSFMAALAHGLPIITTTPAVEIPELSHRGNIYLVPPAAPNALAAAVTALQGDSELRERLAGGARDLAQSFRWDRIAVSAVELFRELVRTE